MKSLRFIMLAAIASFMLFSCGKKDSLATAVPKDAAMVIHIDMKTLAQKADYNLLKNDKINAAIGVAKAYLQKEEQKKMLDDFLKDPNSLGINILSGMYIFYGADGSIGMVFSINNAKKLYDNALKIDPSFKDLIKQEGKVYSVNTPKVNFVWDNSKAVLYGNFLNSGETEPVNLLNLKADENFCANANYKQFAEQKNDISIYFSTTYFGEFYKNMLDGISEMADDSINNQMNSVGNLISDLYKELGYSMIGGCNFEKGKIVSHGKVLFDNPDAEKKFKNLKTYNAVIKGDLNKYFTQTPILFGAFHLNGKDALEDFNTLKITSLIDSLSKISKKDLNSIILKVMPVLNGDVLFSLNSVNVGNNITASFSLFAEVDTTALRPLIDDIVAKQNTDKSIVKTDKNCWMVKQVYFGYENGIFYVSNDSIDGVTFKNGGGNPNKMIADITGQTGYFGGDFTILKEQIMKIIPQNSPYYSIADEGLGLISTFGTKAAKNKYEMTFEVNFTNKKDNALKSIFKYIDKVITDIPLNGL